MNKMVNVGYWNCVNVAEILAIINPNTKPARRAIKDAKENKLFIDLTEGKKTCSVIIMKSGQIVISANKPETLVSRING